MLNRVIALILLVFFSPIFGLISLIIYLEDGAPIFFTQRRVGKDNKIFLIYKFRSMKKITPNIATHLLKHPEKYILKSGVIFRRFSLDELPNLINICLGEMVFVGPRPSLYNQEDLISLRGSMGIHNLKPGITGWAQVNGRDDLSIQEKVQFDMEYMYNKSIMFDLWIIIKTITKVFTSNGVSH